MTNGDPSDPTSPTSPSDPSDPAGPNSPAVPNNPAGPAGASVSADDPTEQGLWRPLRLLLSAMDDDIGRLYQDPRFEGLKTSFVMELLRLDARGPMTITELAESVHRSHSALSQKVAAMRRAGLVRTVPGGDARSKKVVLTAKARRITGRLAAEWRATEAASAELEDELPYPLSRVVTDMARALERKSFHDRIAEKLARDPEWE